MRKTSGISLMILIFLSLCLITFSLLSVSGATADETLSQKAADRTTEYYHAVTAAHTILARIDNALAGYLKSAEAAEDPESSYLKECAAIKKDVPDVFWSDGTIAFSVPLTEDQLIQIELAVSYPEKEEDTLYQVTAWETVNTREWKADKSMHVYRLPG